MKNYIFQKFLLNCDYESVHLEQISEYRDSMDFVMPYGTEYCLFDLNQRVIRKLPLNELDTMIDTEEDWNLFVESLNGIDQLVIERQETIDNPIIQAYRQATLQAYCYRLQESGKTVFFKTAEIA